MLSNLSIRAKLILSFLTVVIVASVIGIFSIVEITRLNSITSRISTKEVPAVKTIKEIDSLVGSYRRSELLMTLASEKQDIEKYIKRAADAAEKLKTAVAEYDRLITDDAEKKSFGEFKKAVDGWMSEHPKIIEQALANNDTEATKLIMGTSSKQFNAAIKALEENVNANIKSTQEQAQLCSKINSSAKVWIIVALALCIVVSTALGIIISGRISKPIAELANNAQLVASGELNIKVVSRSSDEIGLLSDAFSTMVNSLRDIISRLLDASHKLAASASQLKTASLQLEESADEVVAQAGTVATASEEMAATSGDIAQNCALAAESSMQANSSALSGVQVIQQTVANMGSIAQRVKSSAETVQQLGNRSDQIGAIIGTIEDIADQTNLLALNAAIEAARAGEQGRGFAVVADEVRALAERTTRATREISEMIKAIQSETKGAVAAMDEGVSEVARGSADAAKSESTLADILEQIASVTDQVRQIATAAEEQTATTNQISSNILEINEVVNGTAKNAQDFAAASATLTTISEELQSVVARFRM